MAKSDEGKKLRTAIEGIGTALVKTLDGMRPSFVSKYGLSEQEAAIATAQACAVVASRFTAQAAGLNDDKIDELERRLCMTIITTLQNV